MIKNNKMTHLSRGAAAGIFAAVLLASVGVSDAGTLRGRQFNRSLTAAETTIGNVEFTFYGAGDNCPPGPAIAYEGAYTSRTGAGGTGSHANPITFAGATAKFPKGTMIYITKFKKYFVMEDYCNQCVLDHDNNKIHIDLWMGPATMVSSPTHKLSDCQSQMGSDGFDGTIIVNPKEDKDVDTSNFYSSSGKCIETPTKCQVQSGDEYVCGNSCKMNQYTMVNECQDVQKLFGMSDADWKTFNIENCVGDDCVSKTKGRVSDWCKNNPTGTIPDGTQVCMANACG